MGSATLRGGMARETQRADTKVLYLMGAGRSGSTILGVALGNCEGVFYAGELDKWLGRHGVPPLEGEERARFWGQVRERVAAEDLYGPHGRAFDRSGLLLSPAAMRTRRRLRRRYREVARELYQALAAVSGAQVLVDSAHYPRRARELQGTAGIELYLLFLQRDPQAVVASFARTDVPERSFGVLTANAYLWVTNLIAAMVFLRQPRSHRLVVHHEDFLADPRGVLEAVLAMCGAGPAPEDLTALRTGPVFQSNRLAREQLVTLRAGSSERSEHSRLTALLQWPLRLVLPLLAPVARSPAPTRQLERSAG